MGNGYSCSLCGYLECYKGRTYYLKMPILKAFHIIFMLAAKKKGMSTTELGAEIGVQQKAVWLFKRKIQVVMKHNSYDKAER